MTLEIRPAGSALKVPGEAGAGEQVPFPYVVVPGEEAENAVQVLGHEWPGATPVIIGPVQDVTFLIEAYADNDDLTTAEILAKAAIIDPDAWMADRVKGGDACPRELRADGEWPADTQPLHDLLSVWDRDWQHGTRSAYLRVAVALLPTADVTEAAAHLRFGDWNACPEPAVHVAFARRWHERYGARLVINTFNVLEFRVSRPPATQEDALRLAREQFIYCVDIVEQGVGTVENLAASLLDSTVWYFWWD